MFRPKKLSALRAYFGMTQKQLAEETGISRPTIQRLELGRTKNPRLDTLEQISECFAVDMKIFYTDEELSLK